MAAFPGFLVDAHLPAGLVEAIVGRGTCRPVPDADWSDAQIWRYALEHSLFILTKDTDFEHRVMQQTTLRVVLLCTGNLKRRDLSQLLRRQWPEIRRLCERTDKRLIKVFADGLEAH